MYVYKYGGGEEGLVNCYYVYGGRGKRAWSIIIMCMEGGGRGLGQLLLCVWKEGEEGLVNYYYVYGGRGKKAWSIIIMCMEGGGRRLGQLLLCVWREGEEGLVNCYYAKMLVQN